MTDKGEDQSNIGVDKALVYELADSILHHKVLRHLGDHRLPDRESVDHLVELCRHLMFPGFFGRRGLRRDNLSLYVEELLSRIILNCEEQVRAVLRYMVDIETSRADRIYESECDARAREITEQFVAELPAIRCMLATDVRAAYDGDPAAVHTDETIFSYPGIEAIFSHRIAHCLYKLGVPLLPRIIQEAAHSRSGIDIHPGAQIGCSFFIDHGGAVVIGETTQIGDNVRIYQGVTLGAISFVRDQNGNMLHSPTKRHPTIGNRVTIYAGAVILGGDTMIGDECVISGGVFVRESVPPGHMARQNQPELVVRTNRDRSDPAQSTAGG